MRRSASLIGVALLGVLGCQGGNEATSIAQDTATGVVTTTPTPTPTLTQNEPTPEEQLLRSIRSCDVRQIVFGHGGITYVRFRGGERSAEVRLGGQPAVERIAAAAYEQRCTDGKRILVAIE